MVTNPADMIQDEHDDVSGAKRILMYGTKTDSSTIPILLNDDGTIKGGGGGITNLDGGRSDANFGGVAISPIDGGNST